MVSTSKGAGSHAAISQASRPNSHSTASDARRLGAAGTVCVNSGTAVSKTRHRSAAKAQNQLIGVPDCNASGGDHMDKVGHAPSISNQAAISTHANKLPARKKDENRT